MNQFSSNYEEQYSINTNSYTLEYEEERSFLEDYNSIPLTTFSTGLSGLQAITKFLHEERGASFTEISRSLGRSVKTIWATYNKVKNIKIDFQPSAMNIPLNIFSSRILSIAESLTNYLKELGFKNIEIAEITKLDPRTTWTLLKRAETKLSRLRSSKKLEVVR